MTPELNRVYVGPSEATLKDWPDNWIDACVTDPPYELKFIRNGF